MMNVDEIPGVYRMAGHFFAHGMRLDGFLFSFPLLLIHSLFKQEERR